MTITDCIAERRIENTQELLENTVIPIQDIASLCGYDDPAYFTRLFKKRQESRREFTAETIPEKQISSKRRIS